jgi:peptide/nickel transport system permease protein
MHIYFIRRLWQLIPTILVMSVVVFSLTLLLPGDAADTVLGETATEEQRERWREEMGLNKPIYVQYFRWFSRAIMGDLGRSIRTQEPVVHMLAARIPTTVELAFLSMLLAISVGIPAGIMAAKWRNTWIDFTASFFSMFSMAIPFFWLGVLLIMIFAVNMHWLPPSGHVSIFEDPIQNLKLMILPSLTIGMSFTGLIMRQTRTAMLQILMEDYVRTARAKGLSELMVTFKHALRNALIPITTVAGLQVGMLLGGAVVTETIFSIPGLGRMIVEGIFERDFPVVQGAIIVIVLFILTVNLFVDFTYTYLDKRVKLR